MSTPDFSTRDHDEYEEDLEAPRWAGICESAARMKMRPEDLQLFLDHGMAIENIPKFAKPRRDLINYLRRNGDKPPVWMRMSGLFPEIDHRGQERRRRLRYLHRTAMLLIRRELRRSEVDPERAELTVYWDPAAEVCAYLEIAPSKLSGFLKEFNGCSLTQTIDCVRVEGVRALMRGGMLSFLTQRRKDAEAQRTAGAGEEKAQGACLSTRERAVGVWREIRAARRAEGPGFSLNSWAWGLGFSSYRRLYRACAAKWRKTPGQVELEVLEEVLGEGEDGALAENAENAEKKGEEGMGVEELSAVLKGIKPIDWEDWGRGEGIGFRAQGFEDMAGAG